MDRVRTLRPGLIIADISRSVEFPDQRLRELRSTSRVPLLIIGPDADDRNAVRALKLGGDGYMAMPVGQAELTARVAAHLRRYWDWAGQAAGFAEEALALRSDGADGCTVTIRNRVVKLSPTECRLLSRLAQEAGQPVSRQVLSAHLWSQQDGRGCEGMVSLYIHYLRKKLEDDPRYPRYIRTKRGGGYYLVPEGD